MNETDGTAHRGAANAASSRQDSARPGFAWRAVGALALAAAILALGAGCASKAGAAVTIRANPSEVAVEGAEGAIAQGYDALQRHIAKASGNSLGIERLAGAGATPSRETLRRFADRRIDIAPLDLALYPDAFAFSLVLRDLTLMTADPFTLAGAATEFFILHCFPCFEEFRKAGILPLAVIGAPTTHLFSRNRAASLEEMSARRILAGDAYSRWIARMGGAIVPPAGGRGASDIDGEIATLAGFTAARSWSTLRHATDLAVGTAGPIVLIGIGMAAWDDLGLGDRAALITAAPHALAAAARAMAAGEAQARARLMEQSVTFHRPNTVMAARHVTIRNESIAAASAAAERRGLIAAGELVDRYALLVRRWSGLVVKLGPNADGLEELLEQEIYRKINAREFRN